MLLAGDIGGTKTLLGLFSRERGRLRAHRIAEYSSQDAPSLEHILERFLGSERLDSCAFGVAGPVVDGRSQVVNVRWPVDERRLSRRLGIERVRVINDLEATGWGLRELPPAKLVSLTPGLRARPGNAALIAAGTGLGMCLLIADGSRTTPHPSEGGHQEFAPRNDLEADLAAFVRRRYGRASVERVVSGPGFSAIYQFLIDAGHGVESPAMTRRLAEAEDTNAEISAAGMAGEDPLSERVVDWWISLYGSAAGDFALVARATGGVFVGGGIVPQLLPRMRRGGFVSAFRDKGRLTPLLEQIPIRVILEPRAALIGAAACAEAQLESKPRRRRRPRSAKPNPRRASRSLRPQRKIR